MESARYARCCRILRPCSTIHHFRPGGQASRVAHPSKAQTILPAVVGHALACHPSAARTSRPNILKTHGKLNCGAGCQPAADWQSACALAKESFGPQRRGSTKRSQFAKDIETEERRPGKETVGPSWRKPLSYSEFVRKNSLVTSFQFIPGSAASRSSAGRPPSAATAPASDGCRA